MSIVDPREDITHPIEIGQVYTDSRNGDDMVLVYLDGSIAVLRDRNGSHRLSKREDFDRNVGAGRYSLQEADAFGQTGRLDRVIARAEEYEEAGGRKNKHFAEAMREAVDILTDQGAEDAHEPVEFEDVPGVGESTAAALRSAGYRTRGDVRKATDENLLDVSGIGEKNLGVIRERVE